MISLITSQIHIAEKALDQQYEHVKLKTIETVFPQNELPILTLNCGMDVKKNEEETKVNLIAVSNA